MRALGGFLLATMVAYAQFPRILKLLMRPPIEKLVYTSPAEPFFAQCKVSLAIGLLISFPWLLFEAWRFVAPGLKRNERGVLLRMIPASYALFLLGSALGLFGAAPVGLKFLLSYSTAQLQPYITLNSYLSYMTYMTLGLGALFQLPLILFVLAYIGIIPVEALAKYRRHVFLGLLIVAAAITPSPDIYGQLLIAIPTYLLYEVSIMAIRIAKLKDKTISQD